jgi:hypothetical protein
MDGGNYIEIAGGKITEVYEDDYNMYAGSNIITTASKGINEVGEDDGVSYNSPSDAPKIDKKENSKNYWILYDGTKVNIYDGIFDDTDNSIVVKNYNGTSGGEDNQIAKDQKIREVGPIPEGEYSLNLNPSFKRLVKINSNGDTIFETQSGVQILPWGNSYGILFSGWGQWRARLDKVNVNSIRDNFYFHDSYKGYSHGCIETATELIYDLQNYQSKKQSKIKIRVKYPSQSTITNGGTLKVPPPWAVKYIDFDDGSRWYVPDIDKFIKTLN